MSLSALSAKSRKARVPVANGVKTKDEGFAVALQENNQAFTTGTANFASEGAAREWMAGAVANDKTLANKIHVVPQFELAA